MWQCLGVPTLGRAHRNAQASKEGACELLLREILLYLVRQVLMEKGPPLIGEM